MPPTRARDEIFAVLDGHLVRTVVSARGKPYEHRCPGESFVTVAHTMDEFGESGIDGDEVSVEPDPVPRAVAGT